MALKIDITKEDTLIPSQAFKVWAEDVLTEEGIRTSGKNFFTKLGRRSKDLQKRLADLKQKIDRCPAGSDVWFNRMFLWPFGGTVTADAKEYFDELEKNDKIKDLETAAETAAADRQTKGTQLTAACAAALAFFDGESSLLAAVGELSVALTTTAPPAATVTDESLYTLFNDAIQLDAEVPSRVSGGPILAGQLTKAIGFAYSAKDYVKTNTSGKPHLLGKIKVALGKTPVPTEIIAVLNTATPQVSVDQAKKALESVAGRFDENRMFSSLDILLESGRITQEDYNRTSKRLLRTSSIINEQATPAELASRKAQFDGFASSIKANGEAIIAELKGLQSLGQKLSTRITESIHRKVMKAHIKKRLLQETANRDSREQLNEFFLFAALLAALTGALAWAAAKVAEFFKNSEYGRDPRTATYPPRTPADRVDDGLQALGASMNAGYGPDGVLVGSDGKKVAGKVENKKATIVRINDCVANIKAAMTLCGTIEAAATAAVLSPPTLGAAAPLATYLGVADSETDKINAASAALGKLQPYKSDIIKDPIETVIDALEAV